MIGSHHCRQQLIHPSNIINFVRRQLPPLIVFHNILQNHISQKSTTILVPKSSHPKQISDAATSNHHPLELPYPPPTPLYFLLIQIISYTSHIVFHPQATHWTRKTLWSHHQRPAQDYHKTIWSSPTHPYV